MEIFYNNPQVTTCHNELTKEDYISVLLQVSDFPEDQFLVAVFPGVPTAAELFLLPHKNQSEGKKKSEEELEQVRGFMERFFLPN